MVERLNARRYLWVLVVIVALFVSTVGVTALAQTDEGDVFTGCVNDKSGVLSNVAVGLDPAKPCNPQESQITWDRAGPALEERIAALEEQVADLEEPYGTLELMVDCAAGDTVGAALGEAQTHPGPVNITISGVCEENVGINRDDVSLAGLQRSDGIRAANSASTVHIGDARGVTLRNMTISGGSAGISAASGSAFTADNVTVRGASVWAVVVSQSSAVLRDCSIVDNTQFGVTSSAGGSVLVERCEFSGNEYGLYAEQGGTLQGFDLTVNGNRVGVHGTGGGTIAVFGSSIVGNAEQGVFGLSNGTINLSDTRVADNGSDGVAMDTASVFNANDTVVEGNSGSGINVRHGSTAAMFDSIVRNNTGDGLTLYDLANGTAGEFPGGLAAQIVDNGGWGINCAGPAAISSAQYEHTLVAPDLSGNGLGEENCS